MSVSDHKYVNFSQDHELNRHLQNVQKRKTEKNRDTLRVMGDELKSELDKKMLTHEEFHPYVIDNRDRLD